MPATEVSHEVEQRLKRISRTARLKGFRPGKVPFAVIRRQFGEQVHAEVVQELVKSSLAAALDEQKLQPAAGPRIEPIAVKPGMDLRYAAVFEVMPEVRLKPFEEIKIVRPTASVTESDVDAMVESMRRQRPVYKEVDRPAQDTDRVLIAYVGRVGDAEPFEQVEEAGVVIGSNQSLPELEEGLKGVTAGEQRVITATFPVEHRNKELAGRTAQVEVHIKSVEEASLPEVDEEFCRAYGVEDGRTESLRQEVRKSMERELAANVHAKVRAQVLEALYQQNPIEVPRALLDEEVQRFQVEAARRMGIKDVSQLPPPQQFERMAHQRAALNLILAQIVKAEGLTADSERVLARVDDLSAGYEDPEAARRAFLASKEAMGQVGATILEERIVEWVAERAQVTEQPTTFSELTGFGREAS